MALRRHLRLRVSRFIILSSALPRLTFYYPALSSVCCVTASKMPLSCQWTRHSLWSVYFALFPRLMRPLKPPIPRFTSRTVMQAGSPLNTYSFGSSPDPASLSLTPLPSPTHLQPPFLLLLEASFFTPKLPEIGPENYMLWQGTSSRWKLEMISRKRRVSWPTRLRVKGGEMSMKKA